MDLHKEKKKYRLLTCLIIISIVALFGKEIRPKSSLFDNIEGIKDINLMEIEKINPKLQTEQRILEYQNIIIDESNETLNWSTYDWITGEGTKDNPYQITNIIFHAYYNQSLRIRNAKSYCNISNCTFISDGFNQCCRYAWFGGIEIVESSSITIQRCQIESYPTGIFIRGSSEILIDDNQITKSQEGIFLQDQCHQIQIQNNYIPDAKYCGIGIGALEKFTYQYNSPSSWSRGIHLSEATYSKSDIIVSNNLISHSYAGINDITGIGNITFKNNIITDCTFGEVIIESYSHSSYQNLFRNNTYGTLINADAGSNTKIIENNYSGGDFGIFSFDSLGIDVNHNQIENCQKAGIFCWDVSNGNFSSNIIKSISKTGFSCIDSESLLILNNLIEKCSENGVISYNSQYLMILNNIFRANSDYHIFLNQTSHSKILNNDFDRLIKLVWISKDSEDNELDILSNTDPWIYGLLSLGFGGIGLGITGTTIYLIKRHKQMKIPIG